MATATNPVTGDKIATKVASQNYLNNFDSIFRKKTDEVQEESPKPDKDETK